MSKLIPVTLVLLACGSKSDDTSAFAPASFAGGNYQLTSYEVNDGCLGGAFEALFLPEGAGTVKDWQYPVELPAWDALPQTYDVQIQDPFSTMQVTVEAGPQVGTMVINGAQQTDVEYDADTAPGCLIDMGIQVEIVIDSATEVHGTATMSTGSFDEEYCPAVDADPCDLQLQFTGVAI